MKHALVAGGNGFIGRNLCAFLLEQGYKVSALDSFITSVRGDSDAWMASRLPKLKSHFQCIEGDIIRLSESDVRTSVLRSLEKFGPVTEIYNMASPASPVDFSKMPDYILQTAAVGHRNLLALAKDWKAPILFASSSEVYGDALVHPQPETYYGNVNPIGHRGCYDEAKRYGEAVSFAWMRQYGVSIRVARIFNTYGPGMRLDDGRVVPNFFVQGLQGEALTINGSGQQTRSFCFVGDLVQGLFALMQKGNADPVNLGAPFEYTISEIAKMICELTQNKLPIRYLTLPENDPKVRKPNLERAQATLGWAPRVTVKEGLELSLSYFQDELRKRRERVQTPTVHPN